MHLPTLPGRLHDVVGLTYMAISVAFGVYVLVQTYPYMKNDYFWPSFLSSNTSSVLAATLNNQLSIFPVHANATTIDLLDSTSGYTGVEETGQLWAYARKIMYEELTTLDGAIHGLRDLETQYVIYMIAQYCWVDLDRRWVMAHTQAREKRCWERDLANGAVYLETVLRNIDFNAWVDSTQGLFDVRIGNGVVEASPVDGPTWLTMLQTHLWAPLETEIKLWSSHGLTHFALQYANQYQIGAKELVMIRNAIGISSTFVIKNIPYTDRGALWTTDYMYAGLRNDFIAIGTNHSLIMNSSWFWGGLDPTQLEYYNIGYPLPAVFFAAHSAFGYLANLDLRWITLPSNLVTAVNAFRRTVLQEIATNKSFAAVYNSVSNVNLHPTPMQWLNSSYTFYGGNPMCGYGSPLQLVQESFGFDDACSTTRPLTITLNPFNALFAMAMLASDQNISALQSSCLLVPQLEKELCTSLLSIVRGLYGNLETKVSSLNVKFRLNISLIQFVQVGNNQSTLALSSQSILEPSWALYGWTSIYDWALNKREVVSFEGDQLSVTVMSYATTSQSIPTKPSNPSLGMYMWYCAVVASLGLCGISMLLLLIFLYNRPHRCNWLVFNRVVSSVWLNRSLLLTRAFACIVCQATVPLSSSIQNGLIIISNEPRSIFLSGLLASESVWITYVIQDVLNPMTVSSTRHYAPWTSHLAFIIVLVIDIFVPVQVSATLKRDCLVHNMDRDVQCTSADIMIGSWERTLSIIAINVAVVLMGIVLSRILHNSSNDDIEPSLFLSSASIAYLNLSQGSSGPEMDNVTAFMAGLVNFGKHYRFDIKLWRVIDIEQYKLPSIMPLKGPIDIGPPPATLMWKLKMKSPKIVIAIGLGFMVATLTSNILYLTLAQSFLVNDFGWEGFNGTGVYAYLANQFNTRLLISNSQELQLSNASFSDWSVHYNTSTTSISRSFHAPRRQLHEPSIPLSTIIQGLRDMDSCRLPWMMTQYCWLDFSQTWEMASSVKRQLRCRNINTNGAVYLESGLRNLKDWDAWNSCWGSSFEIGFKRYLNSFKAGQTWLTTTMTTQTSIDEEIDYWKKHNIVTFDLQWQNYKTMGMQDNIIVVSAIGYSHPLQIGRSKGEYHLATQTSLRMYWTFASDLWAIATNLTLAGDKSLIRSSSTFAFSNETSYNLLLQNLTLIAPLTAGLTSLSNYAGPFGSVDLVYVPCSNDLLQFYAQLLSSFSELLIDNHEYQIQYNELPEWPFMLPTPSYLLETIGAVVVGGNIMCGNDVPPYAAIYGLFRGYGMTNVCHAVFGENLKPMKIELLFAFVGLTSNYLVAPHSSTDSDINAICTLDVTGTNCIETFGLLLDFVRQHNETSFAHLSPLAHSVQESVQTTLNITFVQYASVNNSPAFLYAINLLAPNDMAWNYYGWCYLFEWVTGLREVVAFQGDNGTVTAISARQDPLMFTPDPSDIPVTFSYLCQGCNLYVSWVLICIAGTIAMLILFSPSRDVEGLNLFSLNRIIGHVWAGRTFLIVRSITAMWMLNTSPLDLELEPSGVVTHLTSPQLTWYMTILAASETSWLVYVLNDIFSCITQQYTVLYAGHSSHGTSVVVSIWTFLVPQHYTATVSRTCSYVDMDFEIVCTSGSVALGDPKRLAVLCAIALLNICFWFGLEKWRHPHLPKVPLKTLLLSAQSFYLMHWHGRQSDGDYYLDTTSAIMAGILAVEYNDQRYIFDIKSWRVMSLPAPKKTSTNRECKVQQAIPLYHY
ncbi:hypothetical protein THRCLA_01194 [Thraustotheca clavata]|uniref:Uncharacterized protein n=1 Tax=Thraustotheca clavata TaxID=74557 RepID=A0A1W0A915_9STRA|nr:hypothetical protein THRCLA_01194 [Thraustotheca clavata]